MHSTLVDAHLIFLLQKRISEAPVGWLWTELPYVALAVLVGAVVGVSHYYIEELGFQLCQFMARHGQMRRLVPGTKRLYQDHPISNAWTVGAPYMLLYFLVARFLWPKLSTTAYFSLAPWNVWPFLWCTMVCHNTWFFSMHTLFHKVKPVYVYVHSQHHQIGSSITALGTAFGDVLDVGLCFVAFHLLLALHIHQLPAWNAAAMVLLVTFEVVTNILGHSGYEAPLWMHAIITAGVGLTPLAATSKTHFLHHIDPRYNRSLYFTWWDRLAGTYREHHPQIFEEAR